MGIAWFILYLYTCIYTNILSIHVRWLCFVEARDYEPVPVELMICPLLIMGFAMADIVTESGIS